MWREKTAENHPITYHIQRTICLLMYLTLFFSLVTLFSQWLFFFLNKISLPLWHIVLKGRNRPSLVASFIPRFLTQQERVTTDDDCGGSDGGSGGEKKEDKKGIVRIHIEKIMYWDRCRTMNEILSSSISMPRMKLKDTTDIKECHPPDCSSLREDAEVDFWIEWLIHQFWILGTREKIYFFQALKKALRIKSS